MSGTEWLMHGIKPFAYALFDMDGTLVDSMTYWRYAPAELAARLFGDIGEERVAALVATRTYGEIERLFAAWGFSLSRVALIRGCEEIMAEHYRRDVKARAGALPLLKSLGAAGTRMGIITLTPHREAEICLSETGLSPFFSFVLTPQDTSSGKGKEDPEIFRIALQKLGCRHPSDCAFFEDSLYAVRTAHAMGFRVQAVRDKWAEQERDEIRALSENYLDLDLTGK